MYSDSDIPPPLHENISQNMHSTSSHYNPTLASPRLQIPSQSLNFPEFSGDSHEDFMTWKKTIVNRLMFLCWDDDTFLRFLPIILKGRAAHYYEKLDKSTINTSTDALDALNKKFGFNNRSLLQKCELLNRTQGENESVADYTKHMLHNFDKMGLVDPDTQLTHYLKGLKPHIRQQALRFRPKDISDLEDIATTIEQTTTNNDAHKYDDIMLAIRGISADLAEVKNTSSVNTIRGSNKPNPTMSYCRRCACNHLYGCHVTPNNANPNVTPLVEPQRRTPQYFSQTKPSYRQPRGYQPHQVGVYQNRQNQHAPQRNDIICYQCGLRGHYARNCLNFTRQNHLNG